MYKLIRNGRKVKGMGADNIFRLYPLKFILVIKTKSQREKNQQKDTYAVTSKRSKTYIKGEFRKNMSLIMRGSEIFCWVNNID